MAALDRAFTLAKMDDVAVMVAEYLDLDVSRRLDVLFKIHVTHAECGFGLACRCFQQLRQFVRATDHAHAAPAAAGNGFDDDRIAKL